jgi:hypothetical protein
MNEERSKKKKEEVLVLGEGGDGVTSLRALYVPRPTPP